MPFQIDCPPRVLSGGLESTGLERTVLESTVEAPLTPRPLGNFFQWVNIQETRRRNQFIEGALKARTGP